MFQSRTYLFRSSATVVWLHSQPRAYSSFISIRCSTGEKHGARPGGLGARLHVATESDSDRFNMGFVNKTFPSLVGVWDCAGGGRPHKPENRPQAGTEEVYVNQLTPVKERCVDHAPSLKSAAYFFWQEVLRLLSKVLGFSSAWRKNTSSRLKNGPLSIRPLQGREQAFWTAHCSRKNHPPRRPVCCSNTDNAKLAKEGSPACPIFYVLRSRQAFSV